MSCRVSPSGYFYPRPPRGGRRKAGRRGRYRSGISIHALREEGDTYAIGDLVAYNKFLSTPSARRATHSQSLRQARSRNFYPRPPRGGRPSADGKLSLIKRFLSTPSARRATRRGWKQPQRGAISIHALREEGDAVISPLFMRSANFYPRPPRGGRRLTAIAFSTSERFLSTPSARRATT